MENSTVRDSLSGLRLKRAPSIALPLFILLAALLHLSAVYFFNIVYQVPRVSKPSTAQVFFLLPGSLSSEQLGPWLQGHDPAIFSPLKIIQLHHSSVPADLYHIAQPLPVHLLPLHKVMPVEPPSLPIHEAVLPPSSFFSSANFMKKALPQQESKTTVSFLEGLAPRSLNLVSSTPILPEGIAIPFSPTIIRANVDAEGISRHAIIIQSSGDRAADEAATEWLMAQHFTPSTHETWGTVTVMWGSQPKKACSL